MTDPWTIDKVLTLAPDASAAQAGRQLATPTKWTGLGRGEQVLWGECQGSGKNPYRVQIDLVEPAFQCSCPSRKFPCKHSLGLLLLLAQAPQALPVGETPAWVVEWLQGRAKRAEQKQKRKERAESAVTAPTDPAAAARRAAERQRKVAAGLADLEVWLKDLVRQGLAECPSRPYAYWETMAARMVDAQAPGLARLVREMGSIVASGERWQDRMLARLANMHLLLEGHKRLDVLPAEVQADIRGLVGWTQNQDELLGQPGVGDTWCVLGQRVEQEDNLRVQWTWLRGRGSGRSALVLQFAHGTAGFEVSLVPGTQRHSELVFYPGTSMRALIKDGAGAAEPLVQMPGHQTVAEGMAGYSEALASCPWIERYPLALAAVVPVCQAENWALSDSEGYCLPLACSFVRTWELLAMSGGEPIGVFGEWDGQCLLPLSAIDSDGFVCFASE
jgi:hypothetical protein